MVSTVSSRMNASSSPRGTVKRTCSKINNTTRRGATVRAAAAVPALQVEPSTEEIKFLHVHKFKHTSLFGAWFNDPSKVGKKERLFFGSHLTAYLAARAQDRAALKHRPHAKHPENVKLNFPEEDYALDEGLRKELSREEFGDLLRLESRPTYKRMEQTPLLRQFMEQERALGHLPVVPNEKKAKKVTSLKQYLTDVITKRKGIAEVPDLSFLTESDVALKDPVPTVGPGPAAPNAKPKDQGPKKERKRLPRQELRFLPMKYRNVTALDEQRALRSSAPPVPSGAKPMEATPVSKPNSAKEKMEVVLVWFTQRPNSKTHRRLGLRFLTEFEFTAPGAACSKQKASTLVTEVEVMAPGTARNKLQYKLQKVEKTLSRELTHTASLSLPAQVEGMVPQVEEKVSQVDVVTELEEPMREAEEKESRDFNFNLFMLADVAAEQEPYVI